MSLWNTLIGNTTQPTNNILTAQQINQMNVQIQQEYMQHQLNAAQNQYAGGIGGSGYQQMQQYWQTANQIAGQQYQTQQFDLERFKRDAERKLKIEQLMANDEGVKELHQKVVEAQAQLEMWIELKLSDDINGENNV